MRRPPSARQVAARNGQVARSTRGAGRASTEFGFIPNAAMGERTPLACRFQQRAENLVPPICSLGMKGRLGHDGMDAPPKPARGPRAHPSCFGSRVYPPPCHAPGARAARPQRPRICGGVGKFPASRRGRSRCDRDRSRAGRAAFTPLHRPHVAARSHPPQRPTLKRPEGRAPGGARASRPLGAWQSGTGEENPRRGFAPG